jgi:hypothetical protein
MRGFFALDSKVEEKEKRKGKFRVFPYKETYNCSEKYFFQIFSLNCCNLGCNIKILIPGTCGISILHITH